MDVQPLTPRWYPLIKVLLPGMYPGDVQITSDYDDKKNRKHIHHAWDFQGKRPGPEGKGFGQAVCSPITGEVIRTEGLDKWGAIAVFDGRRLVIIGHMYGVAVVDGQRINIGDYVGWLGDNGYQYGICKQGAYHLHIGWSTAGRKINPAAGAPGQNELYEWAKDYGVLNWYNDSDLEKWGRGCKISDPYQDFMAALMAGPQFNLDPLVLDLDGDGIETTNPKDAGTYFDQDGNGFAEQTGWVAPDDGILVMDRNGDGIINDGKELFGDQTILGNGKKAVNGFEALAELDSNNDGRIDADDPAFSRLRIWKGPGTGEGASYDDETFWDESDADWDPSSELFTLDELGIKSISLNSTVARVTDAQGNTQNRIGTFERTDGTVGKIADYSFQTDPAFREVNEWIDITEDIAALPWLPGYGNVYDLDQAMVKDTSGQLKSLVQQFASAANVSDRESLMEQILFQWTNTGGIDPASRGRWIDARKLEVLEAFFGQEFVGATFGWPSPNPNSVACALLNESYRKMFELWYSELMSQTHLKDLYDKITLTQDGSTGKSRPDFSSVTADIQTTLANDPEQGKMLLSELGRSLRGSYRVTGWTEDIYLPFREAFVLQDPELGWVIDSGGLPVREKWGTVDADAIMGSLTGGNGQISGLGGNDVIYGYLRNETLSDLGGDSLLVGGGGNDKIYAGWGNDIVDGGEGNDTLYASTGNHTYIFRRGSGQDLIIDYDSTPDDLDTIWLGSYLTPEDVMLKSVGDNLVLKIIDTTDTITVKDFFRERQSGK